MNPLVLHVLRRFLAKAPEIPVERKEDGRVVYVLPGTLKDSPSTYKEIPKDQEERVENHGKPHLPTKPRKPKKPHHPEVPRDLTPAPVKPPVPKPLPKPVPQLKPVPELKPPKIPEPPKHPRKWEVKKPPEYTPTASVYTYRRDYHD